MAIVASDIKLYLTGLDIDIVNYDGSATQTNPNISLGGFRSSTEINNSTKLSSNIDADDTTIAINNVAPMPFASAISPAYASIGEEIISYTGKSTAVGSGNLTGVTRGLLGRFATSHFTNDTINALNTQNLFDHVRATENQTGDVEYRCFSVLNTNLTDTAFNVKVYLSPVQHPGVTTSATADIGSGATITDSTLIGQYANDFFNGGTLKITAGTGISPTLSNNTYNVIDYDFTLGKVTISGNWKNGLPDTSTVFILTSVKASPNPKDSVSFAIERHAFANLGASGSATAGNTTSITDSTLPGSGWTSPKNFIGASVLVLSGDAADGVPKRIISYNQTIGKISIAGTFINSISPGDVYSIIRGPTRTLVATEGTAPAVGTGNISTFSQVTSLDTALSINVNGIGEDLIHDELFYVWIKRNITANTVSYNNDNIIPVIAFEI